MDLKEQLVVWKKSSYLLDHVTLSPRLCEGLVDEGLFNADMMNEVYSHSFQVERMLKVLTLLGSKGHDVYEKFITLLETTGHRKVAKEIRRSYHFTHFGEMLPPSFTYFLNLSEFLRMYPHIAVKLGEHEKHIVQTFIEGKLEMEHRKVQEGLQVAEQDKLNLKGVIEGQKREIEALKEREKSLMESLAKADETIAKLNSRVKEVEDMNIECRTEIRRLKHFRMEQEEILMYIDQQGEEYGLPKGEEGLLQRMPSQSNFKTGKALVMRLRFLLSQVNLMVNKLYYMQQEMEHLENEEKKLVTTMRMDNMDWDTVREAKKVLAETKKEKQTIAQQIEEGEREMFLKDREIQRIRSEIFGMASTPDSGIGGEPDSLKTKMGMLLDGVKKKYRAEIREIYDSHGREIAALRNEMQEEETRHQNEVDKQKWKYKQKMIEIHKIEMLHKRMRNQINVITRYHAKNMNATQTVEQCRKVVRSIIGEARKLKAIADQKDRKEEDMTEEEREKLKEEEEKKSKRKQKRKRKKWNALANERLMYVADRIMMKWRLLGKTMGITNNRMDMAEYEVVGNPDKAAFMMLKIWRDEDNGKAEQLVNALKEMGHPDLALIVTPANRIEIVKKEDGTMVAEGNLNVVDEPDPADSAENPDEDFMNDEDISEDDWEEEEVEEAETSTASPKTSTSRSTNRSKKNSNRRRRSKNSHANNMAAVPKLPDIKKKSHP